MGGDDVLSALGSLTNALFLIASIYIYIALLRQINRRDRDVLATEPEFGVAEVALATFLIGVFGFSSLGASSVQIVRLRTSDLILNAVVSIGIVLFVVAFLKLRRFNVTDLTGLAKLSFARTFVTGLVLLIFAYPLIIFADWLTARMLGSAVTISLLTGSTATVCGRTRRVRVPWIARSGGTSPVASALNTSTAPPSATGMTISSWIAS